ncbi:MAG TPA: YlxM family DNA-binding protein [Clostridia bacterium]|nr:YlxM family DNA-binding protein [Clostridia bacterium]
MDNVHEISLMLDFYGQLLTDRQYEIMDLHYNNDYSLGEISEQLSISRQGVFDNVKRGRHALYEMEEKLGLVKKFSQQKIKAKEILSYIKKIGKSDFSEEDAVNLEKVEKGIIDIINNY